ETGLVSDFAPPEVEGGGDSRPDVRYRNERRELLRAVAVLRGPLVSACGFDLALRDSLREGEGVRRPVGVQRPELVTERLRERAQSRSGGGAERERRALADCPPEEPAEQTAADRRHYAPTWWASRMKNRKPSSNSGATSAHS